jgi:hypothetical protein
MISFSQPSVHITKVAPVSSAKSPQNSSFSWQKPQVLRRPADKLFDLFDLQFALKMVQIDLFCDISREWARESSNPSEVTKFVPAANFFFPVAFARLRWLHDESMIRLAKDATGQGMSSGSLPCLSARLLFLFFLLRVVSFIGPVPGRADCSWRFW